jgi:hypothetical protein
MPPPAFQALERPLVSETLAVLDFEDARPEFERGPAEVDERFIGGRFLALDRFWSFHSRGGELESDPAPPPDVRARVLGAAALAWFPFPNHGVGRPLPTPASRALADYVALALEQRGLFRRVVRARDSSAAQAAGAAFVLNGRIERLGALLAETRDPFVNRPDDWLVHRLLASADFTVRVLAPNPALPDFARTCRGRDERAHLFDALSHHRGDAATPTLALAAGDFPGMAALDLARHLRRSLESAAAPLLPALEDWLRGFPEAQ